MKTTALKETFTFESSINIEYSCSPVLVPLAKNTTSSIEVVIKEDGTGYFEWDVPRLQITEAGGLWFEGNTLTDYDGVFELPKQLTDFLVSKGYNVDDVI